MTDTRGRSRSKVARLIDEYGLDGVGDELEQQWTRRNERKSVRELVDEFNLYLLRSVLVDTEASLLAGEVENLHRLLTDDDVSRGSRSQARDQLSRHDVDVDQLQDDFVSRQAIHTYLTKYRNATPPDSSTDTETQRSQGLATVQRLKTRLESVTNSVLTSLSKEGGLTLGDPSVVVTVRIHCADCGAQCTVRELFQSGGCDCSATPA